jgi:glycosyltransferase involved in cell wall biosynthesis
MGKDPRISVIIPCYNYGEFINEAVDSVLHQTFSDFEIIIVNDGSTDDYTNNLLADYQRPKTKVFQTKNQGVSAARNYGIERSAGEYILPLDPDDKIGATYLEKAVEILDGNPQIGIVYSKLNLFGNESGDWNWPPFSKEEMLYRNVIFNTALFRKKDWLTVGKYKTDYLYAGEDWDLWLSLLELGVEVHQIQEVLFYYRKHKQGQRSMIGAEEMKDIHTYESLIHHHKEFYQNNMVPLLRTAFKLRTENAALSRRLSMILSDEEGSTKYQIIDLAWRLKKYVPRFILRMLLGSK